MTQLRCPLVRILALCVPVLLFAPGCDHEDDPVGPGGPGGGGNELEPTLSSIQANIFSTTCAVSGCHTGSGAPLGMELSAGRTFSETVNVASGTDPSLDRIEPGDPSKSVLYLKITGDESVGARMPLGGPALSNNQISVIRQWIVDGAQNN